MNKLNDLSGAWSAVPTPLSESLSLDKPSLKRVTEHHVNLGQKGLFLGGTCGEGPFLSRNVLRQLTSKAVEYAKERIIISVQVTDNSYIRVLENLKDAKSDGAMVGIVAEPWFGSNLQRFNVLEKYYLETVERSPMPVGIYSRGLSMPLKFYHQILMHPNVVLFKDSSQNTEIKNIALQVLRQRSDIVVLTGCEFNIASYLQDGYSGVIAGGGVLIGAIVNRMIYAAHSENSNELIRLQSLANQILYAAYGGKGLKSWLTGLKFALVKMGIFASAAGYLQYPLPKAAIANIERMLTKQRTILWPYKCR